MSRDGRPAIPISLNGEETEDLLSIAHSRTLPPGLAQRAQMVLACAAGAPHVVIARRLCVSHVTVGKWRRHYYDQGVAGLHDEQRPGRPHPW